MASKVADLRIEGERLLRTLQDLSAKIASALQELEAKEASLKKQEKAMEENAARANEKVKLDIGGTIFTTSKSTLLRIEGTYFYAMLRSNMWQPDKDGMHSLHLVWSHAHCYKGTYFIDRDPAYFDRILNYLRTGMFSSKDLDDSAIEKLKDDCDYFQIPIAELQVRHRDRSFFFVVVLHPHPMPSRANGTHSCAAAA